MPESASVRYPYLISWIITLVGMISMVYSQNPEDFKYRKWINEAWDAGENLRYKVYYESMLTGRVNAGIAELQIQHATKNFNGRECYHVVGTGRSNRTFDLFFRVRDRFESFIDKESITTHHFIRRTREGGYVKDDDVIFDHIAGKAKSLRKTKPIPPYVQDIISALYFARTMNADTLKPGDYVYINFFLDDSVYVSAIQFIGREVIEIGLGRFRSLAFKPMVATGEVFSNPYPMILWVSDDKNKLPLLAQSAVIIGSVKIELIHYSGLKNPLTSLEKR